MAGFFCGIGLIHPPFAGLKLTERGVNIAGIEIGFIHHVEHPGRGGFFPHAGGGPIADHNHRRLRMAVVAGQFQREIRA